MSATIARPKSSDYSHWYFPSGQPCHTVIAKGTGEPRPTNLKDARAAGLLPSVTNVLRVLYKYALEQWKIEQAILAAVTTPRKDGEELDKFIERVIQIEAHQDQESQIARDKGTAIHDAIADYLNGKEVSLMLLPFVLPVVKRLQSMMRVQKTEFVLVGDGYAGRTDLLGDTVDHEIIIDFKTTKKLPEKSAWPEHQLQLAAYAKARNWDFEKPIKTFSAYIHSEIPDAFIFHENPPWEETYENGFLPCLKLWSFLNNYKPPERPFAAIYQSYSAK